MLSRFNTSSLCATSCVLMHVSYCYYTRKFAAQCEVGEQCRVQANRLKRTGRRVCLIVAVSRDYSWMEEVAAAALMEFLARNRFCGRPHVYLGLTTEMNFYLIRNRRLRFNIDVIRFVLPPQNASLQLFQRVLSLNI